MTDTGGAARRESRATTNRALDTGDLENALGFRLRLAQQFVFSEFTNSFKELDLSPLLYTILVLIELNPGCRQTDLSTAMGVRQPNLVERIDHLVKRGMVSRSPDAEDRRANVLKLTPAGKRFMLRAQATHERHIDRLVGQLGVEDHETLIALLRKLR